MGRDISLKKQFTVLIIFLIILLMLSIISYLAYKNFTFPYNLVSLSTLGLIFLFIIVFLSSFGVPGALFIMIAFGALANDISELIPIIIASISAAVIGDLCTYLLAKRFSLSLPNRLERFSFFRKAGIKIKQFFTKSEFYLVFFTRFLFTSLCAPVNYISGFERIDFKKFLVAVVSGEAIYGAMYPIIGFIFKETWKELSTIINEVAIVVGVVIVVIFIFIMFVMDKKNKRSEIRK